jgi:hypothetical protein
VLVQPCVELFQFGRRQRPNCVFNLLDRAQARMRVSPLQQRK